MSRSIMAAIILTGSLTMAASAPTPSWAASSTRADTVTGTSVVAASNPKITATDAIGISKKLFPQLNHLSSPPNATLSPDPLTGQSVYQINWTPMANRGGQGPDLQDEYAYIRMNPDTGQVLSFQDTKNTWVAPTPINAKVALAAANQWLKRLAPNQTGQLFLVPGSGESNGVYAYLYMSKQNGVWVTFDSALIELNISGQLIYYGFNWHDVAIPKLPSRIISKASATSTYLQALNLKLSYQQTFNSNGVGPYQLVYAPALSGNTSAPALTQPIVDATTGSLVGTDGTPWTPTRSSDSVQLLVQGGPITWPVANGKGYAQSALLEKIRQQFSLQSTDWTAGNPTSVQIHGGSFNRHTTWAFTFTSAKTGEQISIWADATDGVVTQYMRNSSMSSTGTTNSQSVDKLQQSADSFVKHLFPNLTGAITQGQPMKQMGGPSTQTGFAYSFLIHGVPLSGFSVYVDNATGNVVSYNLQTDPSMQFSSPTDAISVTKAEKLFMQHDPLTLQYVLPTSLNTSSTNPGPPQMTYGKTPELVYTGQTLPLGGWSLNALTGVWINVYPYPIGTTIVPSRAVGTSLAMAEMVQHGVMQLADTQTNPSAKISRAQFIQWLARAYNYNISETPAPQFSDVSPQAKYASEISEALAQGWLPDTGPIRPDRQLTRLAAADWIIHWMGWSGPAAHPSMFRVTYSDSGSVPASERGVVAMVTDENILPLQNGRFNPNATMTVAQAADALYRAIQVLLQSQ